MKLVVVTGLSGAGKTQAAHFLEDLDYYCVDNMPVALMPRFAELCIATGGRYENVALVTDVREKNGFGELLKTIDQLKEMNCSVRILYMDADVRTIVRRYKESRRPHPLATRGTSIEDAVHKEMDLLAPIRERADFIVNSSNLTLGMLQNKLFSLFAPNGEKREIDVTVMSFGYKHGLPMEADLVFDVRFLPNPFYVEKLRPMSGMDAEVQEYVLRSDVAKNFLSKLTDMVDFLLPQYAAEGRYALTIGIGCTGGQHRSVAVAKVLTDYLAARDANVRLRNRDFPKT